MNLQESLGGNICFSHDWHLFLIKEYLLGLRPEDSEHVQYLEGVVIYKKNDEYYIANHQREAMKLSIG